MLTVEKCKNKLKNNNYTDDQIKDIRENLYQLANIFVEEYLRNKKRTFPLTRQIKNIQK